MAPRNPRRWRTPELSEVIQVLDVDGNDLDVLALPVGLHIAIAGACEDVDIVVPGLAPPEVDERRSDDD
jgi:hypothetical protein